MVKQLPHPRTLEMDSDAGLCADISQCPISLYVSETGSKAEKCYLQASSGFRPQVQQTFLLKVQTVHVLSRLCWPRRLVLSLGGVEAAT